MDITFSKNEIKKLSDLGISAVILFGSRAQGLEKEKSDYDIGILLKKGEGLSVRKKRGEIYDAVYEILSGHIQRLVNIDIVFLDDAPGELQAHVMKHGQPLFEASRQAFADFRERVMISYADFEYLRNIFHQGILSRIA